MPNFLLRVRSVFRFSMALVVAFYAPTFRSSLRAQNKADSAAQAAPAAAPSIKRRDTSSEEDLRTELQLVPELGFDRSEALRIKGKLESVDQVAGIQVSNDVGFQILQQTAVRLNKPQLTALPWQHGLNVYLEKPQAVLMAAASIELRSYLNQKRDGVVDVKFVRDRLNAKSKIRQTEADWQQPDCVPALVQMLQVEATPIRLLLVEKLAEIPGKESSQALAKRAVFDLAPQVRENALAALATRPANEYQDVLLGGLQWPWKPVVDHAAEAIAALKLKELGPELTALLREPDPSLPIEKVEGGSSGHFVKELVKVNHFRNCVLCHAPSYSHNDPFRRSVPTPGKKIPEFVYYDNSAGLLVRADITYLRQDFSVMQPVTNPGNWPAEQRFDYILRERRATPEEIALQQARKQQNLNLKIEPASLLQEGVLFALREMQVEAPPLKLTSAPIAQKIRRLTKPSILD
ncbi:HEAT repeat domain-containing protein [Anatilimnocola floriformis]|uniref:HEAT repeat domain-containing protein n=1 Tax=Anatilimnocola floriformis TaxID=2948575 RepID=UPI0020C555FA|nr:HEAT repeat domain-containing protein [Anatilimnocola floriformis]